MTDPNKSLGWVLIWKPGDKMLAFWLLGLQIEIYFLPKDWSIKYYDDFGCLSLGPIVFNWSNDDL
jgi:hypothetical protein